MQVKSRNGGKIIMEALEERNEREITKWQKKCSTIDRLITRCKHRVKNRTMCKYFSFPLETEVKPSR